MTYRVLVTARSFRDRPGQHKRILLDAGCELVESSNSQPLTADEMILLMTNVDAVIVGVDVISAEVIDSARRLRVISKYGVGIDNINVEAATRRHIAVTFTPGANSVSVAELTLGLMLALARRIPQHSAGVKRGAWTRTPGVELAGKTLGIVGLGQVGQAVAHRARCFGMQVLYHDIVRHDRLEKEGWLSYSELEPLLALADFVSLHCPLTPASRELIGEAELRAMKPTAFLINTARGGLVDEEALAPALGGGWIAGAASDAFVREPPVDSPLLALDNFVAMPHAGAATHEASKRMALMAARNTILALRDQRPAHVVNPEIYDWV
jgi:D-3-phosphoglycerate dehydrogenase